MKPIGQTKTILILAGSLVLIELLMYLVHQLAMGVPYQTIYLTVPAFFVIFEIVYCVMAYKSLKHSNNTRWFVAFKMIKMLFAVGFIAIYIFSTKTEGADTGLLVRFFVEYMAFLVAETYIGTNLQIVSNNK